MDGSFRLWERFCMGNDLNNNINKIWQNALKICAMIKVLLNALNCNFKLILAFNRFINF